MEQKEMFGEPVKAEGSGLIAKAASALIVIFVIVLLAFYFYLGAYYV